MVFVIKVIGAVMIAGGGYLIGNKIKKQYKRRTEYLKATQDALKYADDAIAVENMLIEDVMKKCSDKFFKEERGGDLWNMAAEKLKSNFGNFENVWEKACNDYYKNSPYLTEKDAECIKDIGKALGIVSSLRQSAHVDAVIRNLNELELNAKSILEKEGKHVVQVALAIAAALIILLF